MPISAVQPVTLISGIRPPDSPYDADIIILALNRAIDTIAAVQSALSQEGGGFFVLVLDQGSEPEHFSLLVSAFAGLKNFGFFTAGHNLGVGGGRNALSHIGHGQIIIALDNDAVFANSRVAADAITSFRGDHSLGALGFNILCQDGIHPDRLSWGYPAGLRSQFNKSFATTTFVGAGHAIRRTAWEEAGGYDANLFFTWEEYDFCLRAIARGWIIRYDGHLRVIHNVAPQARVSWSKARTRYYIRNRLLIARKWGASWFTLLPRLTAYLINALVNRQFGPALRGVGAAILDSPQAGPPMSAPMRRYIFDHETRHRGSWLNRLQHEVFNQVHKDQPING